MDWASSPIVGAVVMSLPAIVTSRRGFKIVTIFFNYTPDTSCMNLATANGASTTVTCASMSSRRQ